MKLSRMALAVTAAVVTAAAALLPLTPASAVNGQNLAAGKTITASSHVQNYTASNANDGNQGTYWESANDAFPQWLQVDLGASAEVGDIVLELPAIPSWQTRTQTIEVRGSTDGSSFTTIVAAQAYAFDPAAGNTVTVSFGPETLRYLRVVVTANTGWPAAQLSELEVYGDSGPPPAGADLAAGRPISASSQVYDFVAEHANDGDATTYWEGGSGSYPSTLTVALGANAELDRVVVKLNPNTAWSTRTQTFSVLGRDVGGGSFTTLQASADYVFDPASGNTVTIPVSGTVGEVQLRFTANTGAPGAQVAEFQVFGTPAPAADLVVTDLSWSPAEPVETDEVTLSARVENVGEVASAASAVDLYSDGVLVATVPVSGLAAGSGETVSAAIGTQNAGSRELSATVDPGGSVAESDEGNNDYEHPEAMVVTAVPTSDLIASAVTWSPSSPATGDEVAFSVVLQNQGGIDSASGAHGVALTLSDNDTGQVVRTLTGSHEGVIASGDATAPIDLGTWTATDGEYSVLVEIEADANELPVKQGNNTASRSLSIGRGADMPYTLDEAEHASVGGGAQILAPNRSVGDLAGEASGRQAVTLDATGEYVEFTTTTDTNTLVTRFAIPDAAGGGGIDATLNLYVDGRFVRPIELTSRYAWLYGPEAGPNNSPSSGPARHVYDEANLLLDETIPAGSTIRLQKDAANTAAYYAIDFISLEQATPNANPDPTRYIEPAGFTHQDVQNALDRFRMDTSGDLLGVYLPAGDYQTAQKFQVYGKATEVIGAGPWFTRFYAPQDLQNTDVGFRSEASANGSTFAGFAYFGNYTTRIDGPGKVFDWQNVADMTIDDVWVEHQVCMFWGSRIKDSEITNSRARNLFADAINMTNGSNGNLVRNVESRASGDDSFALFAATDAGGGAQTGNVYENLTSILTWRAAGLAVYGGYGNTFRNIHIADTLVYSGVTISSLDFGIPMDGFEADPPTRFENLSVVRSGGHFWGAQTFPGIWIFSGDKEFQGIRISNADIVDPTYSGIMFQTKYTGGQPEHPVTDTVFTDVTITGARLSGDEFESKSGFGIWVNEMPEDGQGPAVGSAVFHDLQMSGNHQDIKNTTSTFELIID
ncbi:discoidin domain-containing protein [Glycomyces sp. TRM65418]|uniref:discoidin domain-containing protein n=1 Tax=Glycomyces sp. TRM65418 TaxID=2867006 RepID=UPI001CE51F68|nr:discoidin domain-containing protein [Glycomyces sp. TRM65418]MCC3765833.1 discoidin domain-containing protein [Glycomyces sp. TRM65418]QZD55419.1 discoidin domain-containing protein [Glycomyces sp. TRM65418]